MKGVIKMDENKKMLDAEIASLIECLDDLEPNTEEYSKITDNLNILYKLKIEQEKNETDSKDQKKFRIIGYALEGVGIVLPLVFYGKWMKKGLKFEETGTFTSTTFKDLIRFFKPKKK